MNINNLCISEIKTIKESLHSAGYNRLANDIEKQHSFDIIKLNLKKGCQEIYEIYTIDNHYLDTIVIPMNVDLITIITELQEFFNFKQLYINNYKTSVIIKEEDK